MKEKFNLIEALELMDEGKKVINTECNTLFWFENGKLKSNDNYCSLNIHSQSLLTEKVWEIYEEPKPILDAEEKAYLEAILRPFKNRVLRIYKSSLDDYEYLWIGVKSTVFKGLEIFTLPSFKPDTMYKGMELHKKYTLKELGLFDRKIY